MRTQKLTVSLGMIVLFQMVASLAAAPDFAAMRERWCDLLTGGSGVDRGDPAVAARIDVLAREVASNGKSRDPQAGTGLWDKMKTEPNRTLLWTDVGRLARGSQFWVDSLRRLERMTVAAKTPGSPLNQNPELIADIVAALELILRDFYNPAKVTRKGTSDWWQLEIGVPLFLAPICLLLEEDLPPDLRERCLAAMDAFNPDPAVLCAGTGAERPSTGSAIVNKNRGHLAVGLLRENPAYLDRTRANLERLFVDATSGDGFFVDGSFIMHRMHPYNGGYGLALLLGLSDYGAIVSSTPWALTEAQSARLRQWLECGLAPFVWQGQLMSMVRGREISRWDSGENRAGSLALLAFLRGSKALTPDDSAPILDIAARMLSETPNALEALDRTTPFDLALARSLKEPAGPAPVGFFAYPAMDRAVYRTTSWAAGLALHSTRTGNAESINGENRRGWHTGSGFLSIYNADELAFGKNYWATVDAFRLPGTTVESQTPTGFGKGSSPLTGMLAAPPAADGSPAGIATFTLPAAHSKLAGRKTWFFLPDAVVQLIAGLSSETEIPVETILENRKLAADRNQVFLIDGEDFTARSESSTPVRTPPARWAWLAGTRSPERGIGWVFPEQTAFLVQRSSRSDLWRSVNTGSTYATPDNAVTERFHTLWLDHGIRPTGLGAVFAVLPDATVSETEAFAADPGYRLLSNTTEVQAIASGSLVAAAFGPGGGELESAGLQSSGPALVALRLEESRLSASFCDPTQSRAGGLELDLGVAVRSVEKVDPAITVRHTTPTLQISVDTAELAGRGAVLRATR